MAFTTTGLSNGGLTTHYNFQYNDSLEQSAANPTEPEPARTNAVIAAAEGDFNQMTNWGRTPVGSKAHIYWPQVSVNQMLALARRLYGSHLLSASDAHTIDRTVTRGVT
jgi:hypothetical protein